MELTFETKPVNAAEYNIDMEVTIFSPRYIYSLVVTDSDIIYYWGIHMSVFKNTREWKRVRPRDLFELTSTGKRPFNVFLFLF